MKKILLVEDDPSMSELIRVSLKFQGYEVLHVANGSEAPGAAETFHPDLVLLDMMLPGMDGHSVQAALLANPSTQDIPIIVMTTQSQLEQVFANAPNVVGFIPKPFDLDEMKRKISAIF